jgi:hypothetical protein
MRLNVYTYRNIARFRSPTVESLNFGLLLDGVT